MGDTQASKPLRIAIVGGGIGGLALLLGVLHHADPSIVEPHLYEAAPAFGEIGAGVGFGPNAVSAMKVINPELYEAYSRIAARAPLVEVDGKKKMVWHHCLMGMEGRGKNHLKSMEKIVSVYNDNRMHSVHRARFLDEMLKFLPDGGKRHSTFNKRLANLEDMKDGRVKLVFADGSSETADAVIGCDGVKSRVRQILLAGQANIEPQFSGKYAYRGLIPIEDAVNAIGAGARTNEMFWGYGGHLVTFSIEQGKTFNLVAFTSPKSRKWEHGNSWVVPSTSEEMLEDFEDWCEPVRKLLSLVPKPDKWALFDHPPASTYHRAGKVCLLGDCAHASTPHQGAGAGMAIEDAAVMSSLLGAVSTFDPSVLENVFAAYDEVRRPRTQKLVETSRDAGTLYDFEKADIGDDIEKAREHTASRYRWIWEFDVSKQCEEAIEIMHKPRPIRLVM